MTPNDADRDYAQLVRRLRRALRLGGLTPEQAQAEYEAAQPIELSGTEIDALVERAFALGDRSDDNRYGEAEWTPESDISEVASDVFQLNRNEGKPDPEIDELIEKHRRQALDESSSGTSTDEHSEDEAGD